MQAVSLSPTVRHQLAVTQSMPDRARHGGARGGRGGGRGRRRQGGAVPLVPEMGDRAPPTEAVPRTAGSSWPKTHETDERDAEVLPAGAAAAVTNRPRRAVPRLGHGRSGARGSHGEAEGRSRHTTPNSARHLWSPARSTPGTTPPRRAVPLLDEGPPARTGVLPSPPPRRRWRSCRTRQPARSRPDPAAASPFVQFVAATVGGLVMVPAPAGTIKVNPREERHQRAGCGKKEHPEGRYNRPKSSLTCSRPE